MLRELRAILRKAAPKASETLSGDLRSLRTAGSVLILGLQVAHEFHADRPAMEPFMKELSGSRRGRTRYNFPMASHCRKHSYEDCSLPAKQVKDHDARWMYRNE